MKTLNAYLVEDSPVIRDELIGTLEELADVKVLGVAEGEQEAIDWLASHGHQCVVVIIDIFLKNGSGLGVLRAASEFGTTPHRAVLTNYATDEMRERCATLGAERVFDKSQEIDELVEYCATLRG